MATGDSKPKSLWGFKPPETAKVIFDPLPPLREQAEILSEVSKGLISGLVEHTRLKAKRISTGIAGLLEGISGFLDVASRVARELGECIDAEPIHHVDFLIQVPALENYTYTILSCEYLDPGLPILVSCPTLDFVDVCNTPSEYQDNLAKLLGNSKISMIVETLIQKAQEPPKARLAAPVEGDTSPGQAELECENLSQ